MNIGQANSYTHEYKKCAALAVEGQWRLLHDFVREVSSSRVPPEELTKFLNEPTGPGRCTALHYAAEEGLEKIVRLLLQCGADANARTAYGRTPLHDAVTSRSVDTALALLENGADPLAEDEDLVTPYHLAKRHPAMKAIFEKFVVKLPLHNLLGDDLEKLLDNEQLSDITLKIENQQLHANKCILSVRCPYFSRLFSNGMRETRESTIDLSGICSFATFKALIRFIYTDQVDSAMSVEDLAELLAAAEYFCLDKLIFMCEIMLVKKVDKQNALALLQLAEVHSAKRLRDQCVGFIQRNVRDVLREYMLPLVPNANIEQAAHEALENLRHGRYAALYLHLAQRKGQ